MAVVYAGQIVEYGTLEDIYSGDKHHPYTIGLFGAIPDLTSKADRLQPVVGLMPDPTVIYEGCKFAPRCKFATDKCRAQRPDYYEANGHKILCHRYTEGGCE